MMVITSKCCKYGALLYLVITSFLVQLRCYHFYCVVFLSIVRKTDLFFEDSKQFVHLWDYDYE